MPAPHEQTVAFSGGLLEVWASVLWLFCVPHDIKNLMDTNEKLVGSFYHFEEKEESLGSEVLFEGTSNPNFIQVLICL